MAQRVEKCANRTYIKALNITRTECNRAINRGLQDAAVDANQYMQAAGYVEVKIWHSMKDESGEDINCRCFLEYALMTAKEFIDSGEKLPDGLIYDEGCDIMKGVREEGENDDKGTK